MCKKHFYCETDWGAKVVVADSLSMAWDEILKAYGNIHVKFIREATSDDLLWVEAMGGYIPELENAED